MEFIVKTNFGITYRWSKEQIANDYAATAIQWQCEDDIAFPKTIEELYQEIISDENHLLQWFNDYIRSEIRYSVSEAEVIERNEAEYTNFINLAINLLGREV